MASQIFITMTCNPDWPKIHDNLLPRQQSNDCPDIVVRVFRHYLQCLNNDLLKEGIFEKAGAQLYVIEFEKRGLSHAYSLIILAPECKCRTTNEIGAAVCVEIPENDKLCEIVCRCVVHEYGISKLNAACIENGCCSIQFTWEG